MSLFIVPYFLPFFIAFTIDKVFSVKEPTDFNCPIIRLLHALSFHLVLPPISLVLRLITCLFKLTLPMEHPNEELTGVSTPIREYFGPLTIRLIIFKLTFVNGAVWELKCALAVFLARFPLSSVCCSVSPLTNCHAIHLAALPLAIILPALLSTDKKSRALLVSLDILAFVVIPVCPFPDAEAPGKTEFEFTCERLILSNDKLAVAMHLALIPVALVPLVISPCFDSVAVRQALRNLALVNS